MTSWQDPPPQTRRQAREQEKRAVEREVDPTVGEPAPVSRRAATYAPTVGGDVPDVSTPFSFASAQRDVAAPPPVVADAPPARPRAPQYDSLTFDTLLAASHAGENSPSEPPHDPAAVSYAPTAPGASTTGVRSSATQQVAPPQSYAAPSVPFTPPAAPSYPYPTTPSAAQSVPSTAQVVPTQQPSGEMVGANGKPLTRRELRAMMQAQNTAESAQVEVPVSIPDEQRQSAPGAQPSATAAQASVAPALPPAGELQEPSAASFNDLISEAIPVVTSESSRRATLPAAEPPIANRSAVVPPVTTTRTSSSGQNAAAFPSAALAGGISGLGQARTAEPSPASAEDAVAPRPAAAAPTSTPATDPQLRARGAGHWSTMGDDDDSGTTQRSSVATGTVTTANALILPSVPSAGMATAPLTSTGEVIVTGSIELPRLLGSTGQHPDHFDSSDIDRLFDETDAAPATSSVAPVRASRAVATHTSTRGMITPPKSRGNKLPVALAITAGLLVIGVVALLVAGYAFHAF